MVERISRPRVAPEDQDDDYRATESTDWSRYRACPVCRVGLGQPCVSRSGRVVGGQPDQVRTVLSQPHTIRPLRSGRRAK